MCGALLGTTAIGCTSLQPIVGAAPLLGSSISLEINDAGRVALGGSIGPAIERIDGRLVQQDSSTYVVAVASVKFIRGDEQTWASERVTVKSAFVTSVRERKFSKGRTALISAAAIGVVAAFVTRAIVGSGTGDPLQPPSDTIAQKTRIPWH